MKRFLVCCISFLLFFSLSACSGQSNTADESETTPTESSLGENNPVTSEEPTAESDQSVLVAYFSRSGNTETVAEFISEDIGGELFEIVPEEPYPDDYDATVERYQHERDEGIRPVLASSVENMDDYEVVFVGYPIWGSDIPPVVQTFLELYDFAGKTIVPFCTHGGSRFGRSLDTLAELCPEATILDGYEVSGSSAESCHDEVETWLDGLGFVNSSQTAEANPTMERTLPEPE